MSGISKRVSGSWVSGDYGIMGTATDTITTLPVDIYTDGTAATIGLKGNTVQNGTPTPDNPIQLQETGERTGNLADLYNANVSQIGLTFSATDNMRIVINGTKTTGANIVSIKNPNIVLPAGTYTVKIKMVSGEITGLTSDGIMFGINASTYEQRTSVVTKVGEIGKRTFTLSEDTIISSFDITPSYGSVGAIFDNATFECWFYAGSDDKPYEPYGYKIPISSANTTTPVYLGEVETTRRIYKMRLVNPLSVTETPYGYSLTFSISSHSAQPYQSGGGMCNITNWNRDYNKVGFVASNQTVFITQNIAEWATTGGATQWLEENEVYIWYVLATPETAVVNEPLRKIGDYADTVSGITIPTITGADSFDVLTTLKPSEVSLGYTGWHDASVKEWDGSQWQ